MATVAPERPEILSEPDGLYEVIDGRVVEKPMGVYEVWLAKAVYDLVNRYVIDNSLGRVVQEMIFDLRPTVDRERRPDVAYVSFERWARNRRVPQTRSWAVAPDLAIEIVSPTQHGRRSRGKAGGVFPGGRYGASGWFIRAQSMVYVYSFAETTSGCWPWATSWMAVTCCRGFGFALQRIFEQPEG